MNKRQRATKTRLLNLLKKGYIMPQTRDSERIKRLNDDFRERTLTSAGRVFFSALVSEMSLLDKQDILHKVRTFKNFTRDNDPHGEHDFGSFEHDGQTIFWKIDYYDDSYQGLSPDPANNSITRRVLTILLAEEC